MPATYVVMLGAAEPFDAPGRLWKAVDGDPAYRRIVHVSSDETPHWLAADPVSDVWVGKLGFSANEHMDPPEVAGGLLVFAQEPRLGDEDEFGDWIDTEHVPALAGVTGVLMAHRYEALKGAPSFAAMYYMTDPSVCTSDEWRNASRTPWRDRMSGRNINRRRGLYVPAD